RTTKTDAWSGAPSVWRAGRRGRRSRGPRLPADLVAVGLQRGALAAGVAELAGGGLARVVARVGAARRAAGAVARGVAGAVARSLAGAVARCVAGGAARARAVGVAGALLAEHRALRLFARGRVERVDGQVFQVQLQLALHGILAGVKGAARMSRRGRAAGG